MDETTPKPGPSPAAVRTRRWLRRVLLAGLLFLGLVALALASGYPQPRVLEYAIRRATGFAAQVEGVDLYPSLCIARLQVRAQAPDTLPVLEVQNLTVVYRLFPETGRRIEAVTAERAAVRVDAELLARIEAMTAGGGPGGEAPLVFVPERVSLGEFEAQAELPSLVARLAGVSADCALVSLENFSLEVRGGSLTGRVELPFSGFATSLDGGSVHIAASRDGALAVLDTCRVSLPNLAEVDATARARFEGDAVTIAAAVPDFRILGEGEKTVVLPGLGVPVTIGSLAVSDARVDGVYAPRTGRFAPAAARLDAQATNLRAGEGDSAWSMVSLGLTADGEYPDYTAEMTVNEVLPLQLAATFAENAVTASLALADWPRTEILGVLPVQYHAWLDTVPALERISAQASATVRRPDFDASVALTPGFRSGSPFTGPVRAVASGVLSEPRTVTGDVTVPLEQGSIAAAFSAGPASPLRVDATLDAVEPARLASVTRWAPLPAVLARRVSGTLSATMRSGGIDVTTALEAASGPWGTDLLAPLPAAIEAAFRWDLADATLSGARLAVTAEEALAVESSGWRLNLDPLGFEGTLKGKAAFPVVSPLASELGVGAEVRYQAPVTLRDGLLTVALDAQTDYLQWGDFSFYEAPFHLAGTARLALSKGTGTLRDLALTYGDSSSLNVNEAALTLSPFQVSGPYAFTSKLRLLVDAGLLESIEGSIQGGGSMAWSDHLVITSEYRLEAPLLVTGGSSVALGGIAAAGHLGVDQAITASADVNVVKCALAGVPMMNITAPMTMRDTVIGLNPVAGEVFGGTLRGTASVDLSGDSPVVTVDMRLRNVDLAQFSEKMVPPEYGLQGLAQGRIAAQLTPDGLRDATVKLVSSGDFAMNKALLQNILLEYLRDVPGAQSIERISTEVLGEAAWRAFDSASLDLGWAGNKLAGTADLRSANLNLKIDVNVDEGSMRQILALQQEARLEDIENIRSEPVQQSDQPVQKNE